ncbi:cache domain-containing sensor histidine kinase [Paenibacillus oleatilyticus]|uniref:cache domain-containing sensor histidine kinase n=1 Tax=Paenibacillus oleatilyticus TaxID=2594886 RepID=UPI001C1F67B3|nr:sensor histidine kinase [Paenibacillus oleatilyticus]MBU7319136.1 sensor histidine kinase [Paenibacillus oleatilyticus]
MKPVLRLPSPLFQFKSIRSSIAAAFSCLILVSVGITSFISYRLSADAVEKNSQAYLSEVMKQVGANIQSYFTNMENISTLALTNKDVKYFISNTVFISEADRRIYEKRISDMFQSILYTRKDIASIMVFGYNGKFVSDRRSTSLNPNAKPEEQLWYKQAKQEGGKPVVSSSHVQHVIQNEYRWVVSLSRELKSTDGIAGEGIFLVDLNLSVISEICSQVNLGKRGYVFIVDNGGNIVYHPQQQLIYSNLKSELIDKVMHTDSFVTYDGDESRIYSVHDTKFGWKIVGVAYTDELVTNKHTIQGSFLLLAVFGLAITLLLSFVLSHRFSKPIKNLQDKMKQVEKGNFDIRAEIEQENEIGQLGRTFNLMVGHTKELMSEIIRNEETKRKSELKVLQAQINPHFLYNTLDSIIWMAEGKKHEEVVLMTSALAKLFRASINKSDELVPLFIEIEHIRSYLLIQKMRYKEKLDYRIDVSQDIMACKTIKILLQPFVENAIYHGIKNKPGCGLITIAGSEKDGKIVFTIEDNGLGMTPDQLRHILVPKKGTERGTGVGIANVHERIQLYFGTSYGVSFESEPEKGTRVTLTIPKSE